MECFDFLCFVRGYSKLPLRTKYGHLQDSEPVTHVQDKLADLYL